VAKSLAREDISILTGTRVAIMYFGATKTTLDQRLATKPKSTTASNLKILNLPVSLHCNNQKRNSNKGKKEAVRAQKLTDIAVPTFERNIRIVTENKINPAERVNDDEVNRENDLNVVVVFDNDAESTDLESNRHINNDKQHNHDNDSDEVRFDYMLESMSSEYEFLAQHSGQTNSVLQVARKTIEDHGKLCFEATDEYRRRIAHLNQLNAELEAIELRSQLNAKMYEADVSATSSAYNAELGKTQMRIRKKEEKMKRMLRSIQESSIERCENIPDPSTALPSPTTTHYGETKGLLASLEARRASLSQEMKVIEAAIKGEKQATLEDYERLKGDVVLLRNILQNQMASKKSTIELKMLDYRCMMESNKKEKMVAEINLETALDAVIEAQTKASDLLNNGGRTDSAEIFANISRYLSAFLSDVFLENGHIVFEGNARFEPLLRIEETDGALHAGIHASSGQVLSLRSQSPAIIGEESGLVKEYLEKSKLRSKYAKFEGVLELCKRYQTLQRLRSDFNSIQKSNAHRRNRATVTVDFNGDKVAILGNSCSHTSFRRFEQIPTVPKENFNVPEIQCELDGDAIVGDFDLSLEGSIETAVHNTSYPGEFTPDAILNSNPHASSTTPSRLRQCETRVTDAPTTTILAPTTSIDGSETSITNNRKRSAQVSETEDMLGVATKRQRLAETEKESTKKYSRTHGPPKPKIAPSPFAKYDKCTPEELKSIFTQTFADLIERIKSLSLEYSREPETTFDPNNEALWPAIKAFRKKYGMVVLKMDPQMGIEDKVELELKEPIVPDDEHDVDPSEVLMCGKVSCSSVPYSEAVLLQLNNNERGVLPIFGEIANGMLSVHERADARSGLLPHIVGKAKESVENKCLERVYSGADSMRCSLPKMVIPEKTKPVGKNGSGVGLAFSEKTDPLVGIHLKKAIENLTAAYVIEFRTWHDLQMISKRNQYPLDRALDKLPALSELASDPLNSRALEYSNLAAGITDLELNEYAMMLYERRERALLDFLNNEVVVNGGTSPGSYAVFLKDFQNSSCASSIGEKTKANSEKSSPEGVLYVTDVSASFLKNFKPTSLNPMWAQSDHSAMRRNHVEPVKKTLLSNMFCNLDSVDDQEGDEDGRSENEKSQRKKKKGSGSGNGAKGKKNKQLARSLPSFPHGLSAGANDPQNQFSGNAQQSTQGLPLSFNNSTRTTTTTSSSSSKTSRTTEDIENNHGQGGKQQRQRTGESNQKRCSAAPLGSMTNDVKGDVHMGHVVNGIATDVNYHPLSHSAPAWCVRSCAKRAWLVGTGEIETLVPLGTASVGVNWDSLISEVDVVCEAGPLVLAHQSDKYAVKKTPANSLKSTERSSYARVVAKKRREPIATRNLAGTQNSPSDSVLLTGAPSPHKVHERYEGSCCSVDSLALTPGANSVYPMQYFKNGRVWGPMGTAVTEKIPKKKLSKTKDGQGVQKRSNQQKKQTQQQQQQERQDQSQGSKPKHILDVKAPLKLLSGCFNVPLTKNGFCVDLFDENIDLKSYFKYAENCSCEIFGSRCSHCEENGNYATTYHALAGLIGGHALHLVLGLHDEKFQEKLRECCYLYSRLPSKGGGGRPSSKTKAPSSSQSTSATPPPALFSLSGLGCFAPRKGDSEEDCDDEESFYLEEADGTEECPRERTSFESSDPERGKLPSKPSGGNEKQNGNKGGGGATSRNPSLFLKELSCASALLNKIVTSMPETSIRIPSAHLCIWDAAVPMGILRCSVRETDDGLMGYDDDSDDGDESNHESAFDGSPGVGNDNSTNGANDCISSTKPLRDSENTEAEKREQPALLSTIPRSISNNTTTTEVASRPEKTTSMMMKKERYFARDEESEVDIDVNNDYVPWKDTGLPFFALSIFFALTSKARETGLLDQDVNIGVFEAKLGDIDGTVANHSSGRNLDYPKTHMWVGNRVPVSKSNNDNNSSTNTSDKEKEALEDKEVWEPRCESTKYHCINVEPKVSIHFNEHTRKMARSKSEGMFGNRRFHSGNGINIVSFSGVTFNRCSGTKGFSEAIGKMASVYGLKQVLPKKKGSFEPLHRSEDMLLVKKMPNFGLYGGPCGLPTIACNLNVGLKMADALKASVGAIGNRTERNDGTQPEANSSEETDGPSTQAMTWHPYSPLGPEDSKTPAEIEAAMTVVLEVRSGELVRRSNSGDVSGYEELLNKLSDALTIVNSVETCLFGSRFNPIYPSKLVLSQSVASNCPLILREEVLVNKFTGKKLPSQQLGNARQPSLEPGASDFASFYCLASVVDENAFYFNQPALWNIRTGKKDSDCNPFYFNIKKLLYNDRCDYSQDEKSFWGLAHQTACLLARPSYAPKKTVALFSAASDWNDLGPLRSAFRHGFLGEFFKYALGLCPTSKILTEDKRSGTFSLNRESSDQIRNFWFYLGGIVKRLYLACTDPHNNGFDVQLLSVVSENISNSLASMFGEEESLRSNELWILSLEKLQFMMTKLFYFSGQYVRKNVIRALGMPFSNSTWNTWVVPSSIYFCCRKMAEKNANDDVDVESMNLSELK
jgi:hypothetical protein